MMNSNRKLHYNKMQLKAHLIGAQNLYCIAGRGTGKSTGVIAPRLTDCCINMPLSNNGLLAKTYKQIKSRTLPATVSGWKKLGYIQDVHFVIGKRADKKLRFAMPDEAPADWENVVHWFTGAIISMSSQDRKNDSNGLNLQSLHGDEAKLLDHEDLVESIMPTLRGLPQYQNLNQYRMITWTTDMPTTPEAKWLLQAEELNDPETNDLILQYQVQLQDCFQSLSKAKAPRTFHNIDMEIRVLNRKINQLRFGLTHFLEASSFDNIDILRPEYIKLQRRNLPDFVFETSILNKRPEALEHGKRFYPQLKRTHFYTDFDYSFIDSLNDPSAADTSVADRDCIPTQPLDVVIDWGGKINSMLVCQENYEKGAFNVLKEFFALQPEIIHDLVDKFDKYYSQHKERIIYLYYDRNGNTSVANSKETYAELVERLLYERRWIVKLMSFDENPGHRDKFEFVNLCLSEEDERLPKIRINDENCPNTKIALYNTPIKIITGELKKDKGSERSDVIPQEQATHITDCFDIIIFSKYRNQIDESLNRFMGMIS
jgi:hypothetical protein